MTMLIGYMYGVFLQLNMARVLRLHVIVINVI